MSKIWISGGGGGGVTSDELTLTKDKVPAGQTYVGSDTDDDIGTGTAATVPALTVPTNGRVLIPKGYSDGSKYAANSQATMSAYTITPQTYAQTIDTNGKLVSGNFTVGGYTDYSYLLSNQTVFNNGSWGTLASTGLSGKSYGCDIRNTTVSMGDGVEQSYTVIFHNSSMMDNRAFTAYLNKSIDLSPYRTLRVSFFGQSGGYARVRWCQVGSSTWTEQISGTLNTFQLRTFDFNISTLQGQHFLLFGGYSGSSTYRCGYTAIYLLT